ncbi:MAG TPA: alanine--glyoxylate aminotransferase family protein [Candidatus Polarisedimenticolaceae bacterium]|nr:alanine--glyoxylate aminotransferase family protein [Candidatus Polarisedimenticolaceae bacterium]
MRDDVLTMIPGPTPVRRTILDALARPTTSHQAPSFVETFREALDQVKTIVMSAVGYPFVVSGSGTLAMEMALVNLVASDERLLVVSQGYFGDRWAQLAQAFGIECRLLQAEWGRQVPVERVRREVEHGRYAAVAMTHVDTSTGTAAPVEEYCRALAGRETLLLLDGVCATGGIEERFDEWGLDVVLTGMQKALGAPPGLAILVVSERALARRRAIDAVPAYYADLLRWEPVMEDPARYFSTPPVNEVLALHEAARLVLNEGLARRFARHDRVAAAMRRGFERLGLTLFTDERCRASTLTVLNYPDRVEDAPFRAVVATHGVVVAGALGPIAGKAFRVGHMGNIGAAEVGRTVAALGRALDEVGRPVDVDGAVAEALAGLEP